MTPIQLDFNKEQYKVDVIPSKIVEMIAVIHILANRSKNEFDDEFIDSLYSRLTNKSKSFLKLISGLNFPGAEFIGFFIHEGIYNDFELFIERISQYSGTDFIYLALDRDISKERIESIKDKEEGFQDFRAELCCNLWKGMDDSVKALIYDTDNYKDSLLHLAKEIYKDDEFNRTIDSFANLYNRSAEDIRQKLLKTTPIDLAREIKGKNVANNRSFSHYYFLPSYFLHEFNITAWNDENETFMLFYSVKTGEKVDHEEIDRVLSIFKSLSDGTRLQILQHLRSEPSYGKKLAEVLKLSTATISRQLEQLRSMNLITEEKSDNFKYFRLNNNEIDKLIKSIQEFFSAK